jgi:hypothetical protein
MARIRTIKPEFFRHEGLQDLEAQNPGKCCMLVFAGLWTISDKNGVFEYKPRHIKLDVLPFIQFDISQSLEALEIGGYISRFVSEGRSYGVVLSFKRHQRITGKEAKDGKRFPEPHEGTKEEPPEKQQGNIWETSEKDPGAQEREREREKERVRENHPVSDKPKRTRQKTLEEVTATTETPKKKNGWAIWIDANREVGRPDPLPVGQMTKCAARLEKLVGDPKALLEIMVNFLSDHGSFEEKQGFLLTSLEKGIEKYRIVDPDKPAWKDDGYGWMTTSAREKLRNDILSEPPSPTLEEQLKAAGLKSNA